MSGPFVRKRGGLEMRLGEAEAEILSQVASELRAQVAAPERGEHLWRLFPPAYQEDAEAQSEFARFTGDDLVEQRMRALDDVHAIVARGRTRRGVWTAEIGDDEVHSLLGVLNDARLVLGTRLNVTEDMEDDAFAGDEANEFAYAVYRYLSWLQSFLVDELLDAR